jgi:hypothetical protein
MMTVYDWQGRSVDAETIRRECSAVVSGPGKFEQCARYVPYYWDIFLNGGADRDNGRILGFDITRADRLAFPELKRRRTVKLIEDDQGFVCEV